MTKNKKKEWKEFENLQFVSCPVDIKEPFFWSWNKEAKEIIGEFLSEQRLQARKEVIEEVEKELVVGEGDCFKISATKWYSILNSLSTKGGENK